MVNNNNNNNNDKVTKVFHQEVAKQIHALEKPYSAYYKYELQLILENYNYVPYWGCKEAPFIDIGIPLTHNLQTTLIEKHCIYQELKSSKSSI
jgi:hypothetical protein